MDLKKFAAINCLTTIVLIASCAAPPLTYHLTEQCDYDRVTQAECLDRNGRADEAYRSDIERILDER